MRRRSRGRHFLAACLHMEAGEQLLEGVTAQNLRELAAELEQKMRNLENKPLQ
jgi:hypothetical protein